VTAQSVKTVNGEVKLGDSTKVSGGVMTVNGALLLDKGADVSGKLANVNGEIRLVSAHVGGGISTANGDIDVGSGSRVEGGIHVDKSDFSHDNKGPHVPRVVIGPGAVVAGPLRFEREVKLFVSDSATVTGPIEGATAQKFSGDRPPD
jgi:cytoskeletal protein CcmA (bactofilin family)